jgi:hypothetical protein
MGTLFDAQEAEEEAIARVGANAPEDWVMRARQATQHVAGSRFDFTTDHVWDVLGDDKPHEPRALGAVLKNLAREGIIRQTGEYRKSDRVENHRRPVAVWRTVL